MQLLHCRKIFGNETSKEMIDKNQNINKQKILKK